MENTPDKTPETPAATEEPTEAKKTAEPVYTDPTEARKRAKTGYASGRDLYSM